MENLNELMSLAKKVNDILEEELLKNDIKPDFAEARIYNVKTVGVQGDERTYTYPAEITLYHNNRVIWNPDFLVRLSNKITNEIKEINRVVYVLARREN